MKQIISFAPACLSRMSVLVDILPLVGALFDMALLLLIVSFLLCILLLMFMLLFLPTQDTVLDYLSLGVLSSIKGSFLFHRFSLF